MNATTQDTPVRIRRNEMARLLGVSPRTLDYWCRRGLYGVKLRQSKIGGTVGFTWADVDAFRRMVDSRRGKKSRAKSEA